MERGEDVEEGGTLYINVSGVREEDVGEQGRRRGWRRVCVCVYVREEGCGQ